MCGGGSSRAEHFLPPSTLAIISVFIDTHRAPRSRTTFCLPELQVVLVQATLE